MEGNGVRGASGPRRWGPWRRAGRSGGGIRGARATSLALAIALAFSPVPSISALEVARLQQAAAVQGPRAERAAGELRELVPRLLQADDATRIDWVNAFVNRRIAFAADQAVWGLADHWASPLETFGKGQGDCEDYAIAKYFILLAGGMPASRLRLVYVRAIVPASWGLPPGPQAHMVLAYYADNEAEPQILDNLVTDIRPASRRPDLTPVFSFNGEGLWTGGGNQPAGDPQARLSRWREVLQKARAEGFE